MGESGEWEKKMLFENTARVPLLIHNPDHPLHIRTTELAELVDIYPTAASLAGLPLPTDVDGTDLSPLSAGSDAPKLKQAAFSQFPRCPDDNAVTHHVCFNTNDTGFPFMGFSVRVSMWRYTEVTSPFT